MDLTPQRKPGESFADYRERRRNENKAVKRYLTHPPQPFFRQDSRPKLGKAATKQAKRNRRAKRIALAHMQPLRAAA